MTLEFALSLFQAIVIGRRGLHLIASTSVDPIFFDIDGQRPKTQDPRPKTMLSRSHRYTRSMHPYFCNLQALPLSAFYPQSNSGTEAEVRNLRPQKPVQPSRRRAVMYRRAL